MCVCMYIVIIVRIFFPVVASKVYFFLMWFSDPTFGSETGLQPLTQREKKKQNFSLILFNKSEESLEARKKKQDGQAI